MKRILIIAVLFFTLTSCNKAIFNTFFDGIAKEIPIQKVSYKIAKPAKDTVITWYSPYKVFQNKAVFYKDSIQKDEQFNWDGLRDLLWNEYQRFKEKRSKKTDNRQGKNMKDLFKNIFDKLDSDVSELTYIDRYRQQFEKETDEHPLFTPCAFVEIVSIEWQKLNKKEQVGDVLLRVYIGQQNYQDSFDNSPSQASALAELDLLGKVYLALQNFSGDNFTALNRVRYQIDNNYTNLLVEQIEFETKYTDSTLAEVVTDKINPDLHVNKA